MKSILHITAHMGGGVGKVLSGITSFSKKNDLQYHHKIVLLEKPEKLNFINICKENGVEISVVSNEEDLKLTMKEADIVQLEWWHHPRMASFLEKFSEIETRLIIWSHISGCYYPYISVEFCKEPEKFVFTSLYSYDNPYWTEVERRNIKNLCSMVNSSGGFSHINLREKVRHDKFRIGYIGTQDFSKLHPEFIGYCKSIAHIPKLEFAMVGDQTNQAKILSQAKNMKIDKQFVFCDYVNDVSREFSSFDVFGYILNPNHFGTTENVLLEAMAAGLPVICLKQCTEQYIIHHNETGILVKNEEEYKNAVEFLYNHPEERIRLGENARQYVLEKFSIQKTVENLHQIYGQVLKKEKRTHCFSSIFGDLPYEWFLGCLPPDLKKFFNLQIAMLDLNEINKERELFLGCPEILKGKNKSSIAQFVRQYPKDKELIYFNSLVGNK